MLPELRHRAVRHLALYQHTTTDEPELTAIGVLLERLDAVAADQRYLAELVAHQQRQLHAKHLGAISTQKGLRRLAKKLARARQRLALYEQTLREHQLEVPRIPDVK